MAMMSPTSSVMIPLMCAISAGMSNTMSSAPLCWRTSPFTRVVTESTERSTSASRVTGPSGQNVSNPLARLHCPSLRWSSRAVTSLSGRSPSTWSQALARATFRPRLPMRTPISPS